MDNLERNEQRVTVVGVDTPCSYASDPPYLPAESYPELAHRVQRTGGANAPYAAFRRLLFQSGLDATHYGSPAWNPLGDLIAPGQHILVKPNLVRHVHMGGGDWRAVVTHPSLIRCALDYCALALRGSGRITVGDAPVQGADFQQLAGRMGLRETCEDVAGSWGVPIRLVDFRLRSAQLDERHHVVATRSLGGDPLGYAAVDLGSRSLLAPLAADSERFRITSYDCRELAAHHNERVNEYLVPRTVLEADAIINLPKLKTHRKVALTAALKNLVGINGHKDWLPHHRSGSVGEGGDEYLHPSALKRLGGWLGERREASSSVRGRDAYRFAARVVRRLQLGMSGDRYEEGSWYGNDTLWRTVLDLNRLLVYADREGHMRDQAQRRCLTIVDALIAGDGEGPMEPRSRSCGLLVLGMNPVAVDAALATMVGFDFRKIPVIERAFRIVRWPLAPCAPERIEIRSENPRWNGMRVGERCDSLVFEPPSGWTGHVETSHRRNPDRDGKR